MVITPDDYLLTNEHVVREITQARVRFVDGGGVAAATADLRPGDLIVAVNEQLVDGIDALHRALARVTPGTELAISRVRRTRG